MLDLEPLAEEGGFFRRTAESGVVLADGRRAYSVIYSLITPEGFSAMHRLATDEIWCFHAGDPVESLRLGTNGHDGWTRLGLDLGAGSRPQNIVSAGVWQGTRLVRGGNWALLSCVVAPEFRWEDFELGDRIALSKLYPDFIAAIEAMTRLRPPAGSR